MSNNELALSDALFLSEPVEIPVLQGGEDGRETDCK